MSTGILPAPILIVDDDAGTLDALREQLSWEAYMVFAERTVDAAFQRLREQSMSVIISDQRMPDMTGLEFLARAREIQPHASRVLITGAVSLDTVISAINEGEIFRFISKPWIRAELLATVSNAVHRHALALDNQALHARTSELNFQLMWANTELNKKVDLLTAQQRELNRAHFALCENFEHALELCYRIINTFHPLLGEHTKAVVELCRRMIATGFFSDEEQHVLLASAWLHDIGLVGFERDLLHGLLTDPASLAAEEKALVKQHPVYGQTLAAFVDQLTAVGETIRAHHERFDGHGYPDGITGETIPWTARCLAVAVHFVECNLSHVEAMNSVLRDSGTAFDPKAVRLFCKVAQNPELPRKIRETKVEELSPGMRLEKHPAK